MANLLINYCMNSSTVANPDGTFSTSFTGTTIVPGPGNTVFGNYSNALALGNAGKAACDISTLKTNLKQFCINVIFNATDTVSVRQNIVESDFFPVSIWLSKGSSANTFNLITGIKPKNHDWGGPDTLFKQELSLNKWYALSLVYDYDTLALFLDHKVIAVHAFPDGLAEKLSGKRLFFGTWVDGHRDHFSGKVAGFQLYDGIPSELENLLDAKRLSAEWFITRKYEECKKIMNVGERSKKLTSLMPLGAQIQYYANCAIMHHPSLGTAFEMHGSIYEKYKKLANPQDLGYLICDEANTTRTGGKKSLFSKGGVYWSPATGAQTVLDKIYVEYENLGESNAWGFPTKDQKSIVDGFEQEFQNCRFYYKNGDAKAFEVHGSILTKFLALGGPSKCGFPVSNETDVKKGDSVIGKYSEFENETIYWSGNSGAFEVHGDIREKYRSIKGPLCDLGFPTSDEVKIPNYSGAGQMNTFQKGSILWYGNCDSIVIARPFKIRIGRIESKEREGFGMGQNDLYIKTLQLKQNGTEIFRKKLPENKNDFGGHNSVDVNYTIDKTITPNSTNMKIELFIEIRDYDGSAIGGFGNDFIGKYSKILEAANGWGLRENQGVYSVKNFDDVKSLTWSVQPQVDIKSLSDAEKWWGVVNKSIGKVTYDQYASAFRDVDNAPEWWDVTDWLEKAFYEIIVDSSANKGICFGMSLEGINALKGKSLYSLPLDRFKEWNSTLDNEIVIKHVYQLGATPLWWFVEQFLTGNTHSPVAVFNRTLSEFNRGSNPVLGITQDYWFQKGNHTILPIKWDKSKKPWKITVLDPNAPGTTKELTVDPDKNTYKYVGSKTYEGSEWSGGRLYYTPYSMLAERQRLIVWDLLQLLLTGTIVIMGDDGETVSITDTAGNDLNAFGTRATELMKKGTSPAGFFVGINGFETGIKPGQILIRKGTNSSFSHNIKGNRNGKLEYYYKNRFSEIKLESTLNLNESHKIDIKDSTDGCRINLNSQRDKKLSLTVKNKIGVGGDSLTYTVKDAAIGAKNGLEACIKPGIAGFEIANKGNTTNLNVMVDIRTNGKVTAKSFVVPIEKGVSLKPLSILSEGALTISDIESIRGKIIRTYQKK